MRVHLSLNQSFSCRYYSSSAFWSQREADSQRILNDLNRIIMKHLPEMLPKVQVDHSARIEAFWFRGGFEPGRRLLKKRRSTQEYVKKHPDTRFKGKMTEEEVFKRLDRAIQIQGQNILQLRSPLMIKPFVTLDDDLCQKKDDIPEWRYDPKEFGYPGKCQNGTNTPGSLPPIILSRVEAFM